MSNLLSQVAENAIFVLVFASVIILMFLVAYVVEKYSKKKNGDTERVLSTRKIVVIGMFSAISTLLFMFEFNVPFAPAFYKLDFSELPALIGGFAFGPVAGVMIEFIKILLKLIIKGTSTAFVGELANFFVGCSFILPATIIYKLKKTKLNALIACIVGTVIITLVGTTFNAVYLLPTFAKMYGMPLEALIEMGTAITPKVTNVTSFVVLLVGPLNIVKGFMNSLITLLIYKRISPILKGNK